eukprot:jgi/Mesvir1/19826/Mv13116-RA.1
MDPSYTNTNPTMAKKSSAPSPSAPSATSTPLPPTDATTPPPEATVTPPAAVAVAEVEHDGNEETEKVEDGEPPLKKPKKDPIRSTPMPDMTVGEVRKMLNYIRRNGTTVKSDTVLPNGMAAGDFSIRYLAGNAKKEDDTNE